MIKCDLKILLLIEGVASMMGYAVLQVYHLSYQSKSRSNHFAFLNLVIPDSTAKLVLFDLVFFLFFRGYFGKKLQFINEFTLYVF